MSTIKIFSTHNSPYARLSDNFRQDMIIDGVRYQTATNYIYSNMLSTPTWRTVIRRASPKSTCTGDDDCEKYQRSKTECIAANCTYKLSTVGDQFSQLYEEEKDNRRKEALEIAVNAKLDQNKELADELLATGNRPIVYVSRGKWMGKASPDDDGKNNYGKILMAARHRLRSEQNQQIRSENQHKQEEELYEIYLAYTNLQNLIRRGDNLNKYQGLTATQVLTKMSEDGIEVSRVPDQEVIISEAKRKNYGVGPAPAGGILNNDMFMILKKPKVLTALVRGSYLGKERERKLNRVPGLILDMYCDYLLKKAEQFQDVKPEDYPKARRQQLDTLPLLERTNLSKELDNLYQRGMLSESLSKNIDDTIKGLDIPSAEDVNDANDMANAIRGSIRLTSQNIGLASSRPSGTPVLVWEGDPPKSDPTYKLKGLSPLDSSVLIRVQGKIYPSITYYCIVVEFTNCCIGLEKRITGNETYIPEKAYNMLKVEGTGSFLDLRALERKLDRLSSESYREKLMNNARTALRVKFRDRSSQNVLLSTKNAKLIYDDRNDEILGSKKPEAFNFVGKELMRLREEIRKSRKDSGYMEDLGDVLSLKVLYTVFQNDFLRGWFNMRIRDMCSVIMVMKDYMYIKYKVLQNITPGFVTSVLDGVYQPCSTIFATAEEITVPPPSPFLHMVQKYKGFLGFIPSREDQEKVLEIMWKRLAVIIYYLMKHLEQSTSNNIAIVLKKIEGLASLTKNCTKVLPNDKENCIFSALCNIIGGIHTLDEKYHGTNPQLKEVDFSAAVTILLNVNSLAEQRAMQRKMSTKISKTEDEEPRESSGITDAYIESVRNRLSRDYNEEVIVQVLEDVIRGGKVMDENHIDLMAMAHKHRPTAKPTNTPHRRPKLRSRRKKKGSEGFNPSDSEDEAEAPFEEEFLFEEEEEDIVFSDGEEVELDFEEEEDVLEEDDETFVPDPTLTDKITQAFLSVGVAVEEEEALMFMMDEAIQFVKSYSTMSSKMKTNRINFFASPHWGATIG